VFLRGILFDAIKKWWGETAAIVMGAVLFAFMHVPLYGWKVLPLDFSVGIFLGALRVAAGSFWAPAVAHILADWAGWYV
jgi:membrane protease YdiL (CAAX protease family)